MEESIEEHLKRKKEMGGREGGSRISGYI